MLPKGGMEAQSFTRGCVEEGEELGKLEHKETYLPENAHQNPMRSFDSHRLLFTINYIDLYTGQRKTPGINSACRM
ncbi:hypothetical protein BDN70DRAFT_503663 [Pholiota conissans]|uniref:Uncharacterized protein n=1 Tax=Pholiota conissans TaxID=109636 RepID=A0A9P5YMQ3_9AGAR|nr:hypothetical protein BDN70DRAFT_503663 [Pholiota conissans]